MQRLDGMVMMNDGLFEGENLRQLDKCMWLALRELRSNLVSFEYFFVFQYILAHLSPQRDGSIILKNSKTSHTYLS